MKKLTLKDRIYMGAIWLLPLAWMLGGCTKTVEVPVIKEVAVEVKVPVSTPCIVNRPTPPASLRDKVSVAQWRALSTDQRENLLASQSLERKVYQDRLEVSTAGCH